jgi:ATP-binding cassette subfamily B protein
MGMVAQETQLFTGTVRENLQFVSSAANDDQCRSALDQAKLGDFVRDHADGLDAMIGE